MQDHVLKFFGFDLQLREPSQVGDLTGLCRRGHGLKKVSSRYQIQSPIFVQTGLIKEPFFLYFTPRMVFGSPAP